VIISGLYIGHVARVAFDNYVKLQASARPLQQP